MIHQTDSTGLSKGQSKLVDEAYDETGTWAEFKESSKPQPVDFMNGDTLMVIFDLVRLDHMTLGDLLIWPESAVTNYLTKMNLFQG